MTAPTLPAPLPDVIAARYRAAKLTTRQFANESMPSIVNHHRIEAIMNSVQELAVLAADELYGEDDANALGRLETEILTFVDERVIAFATEIEAGRIAGRKGNAA